MFSEGPRENGYDLAHLGQAVAEAPGNETPACLRTGTGVNGLRGKSSMIEHLLGFDGVWESMTWSIE